MEKIPQVYDRIFKRMFTLSNKAVINAINGLFGKEHPLDSEVQYANREMTKKDLAHRFADIFITIDNQYRYHIEAQMYHDSSIVVRVFEYGLYHALQTRRDDQFTLRFPEPVIMYFGSVKDVPKETVLNIDFGGQGQFTYRVRSFAYQEHDLEELNRRKLILFIPFQVLRMKDILMPDGKPKVPSSEEIQVLQKIFESDILDSIETNLAVGNITVDDYNQLRELTNQLYEHVLENYVEKGGDESVKKLLPGAIELPNDVYRIRIDELEQKNAALEFKQASLEEKNTSLEEKNTSLEEKNASLEAEKASLETNNAALLDENAYLHRMLQEVLAREQKASIPTSES